MARELKTLAALILAITLVGTGTANADVLDDREAEPVVLTADQTPKLLGTAPGEVVGFAWFEGWGQIEDGWVPVTVQVDQRKVYGGRLVYADPGAGAGAGADDDASLDQNDEIAMMAYDAGLPAGDRQAPAGVDPASRTSIRISDPLDAGQQAWIYLFRSTGGLAQDGGDDFVSYFRESGSLVYRFPEKTSVVTARYDFGIRGSWMLNRLSVAAGEGPDQDILDGEKLSGGFPGCVASELALSRGEGGFLAEIDGPVRVIRSVTGEAGDATFWRDYTFYEGILDTRTAVRGLPAGSSVISALDLSRQAIGMTYRNSENQEGVRVDGSPDQLASGPATWEQVTGKPGAITSVSRAAPGIADGSTFYEDRIEAPRSSPMGCSGDGVSIGAAGQEMSVPADGRLEFTKRFWFDGPEVGADRGRLHSRQVDSPLRTAIDAEEPAILVSRARPSKIVLKPGQSRTIRVVVRNHGRKKSGRVKICARTTKWARARCRAATKVSRGGKVVRPITVRASRKAGKGTRVLPIRATASKARSYGDRVRVSIRRR